MEENKKGSHGRGGRIRQHRVLRCGDGGTPWEGESMRGSQSAVASSSESSASRTAVGGHCRGGTSASGRSGGCCGD